MKKISPTWDCWSAPRKRPNSFAKGGTSKFEGHVMPN